MDLPNELILYILSFLKERDICWCRMVSPRLRALATDPALIRSFPHVLLKGGYYFKEEAYYRMDLLTEIIKEDRVDLEWLIRRTDLGPNMITWTLVHYISGLIARKVERSLPRRLRKFSYRALCLA